MKNMDEYDVMKGMKSFKDLELPEPKATKKPTGLLNKIASKIGMKVVSGAKKKVILFFVLIVNGKHREEA